jgi:excisionase family DNA binding protein
MTRQLIAPPPHLAILTTAEAAHALGVQQRTVIAYLHDGKLAGWRTPGGDWRCNRADLIRLACRLHLDWAVAEFDALTAGTQPDLPSAEPPEPPYYSLRRRQGVSG